MGTKMRSLRVGDDLWEWLGEEAARRGSDRTALVVGTLESLRSGGAESTGKTPFPNSTAAVRPVASGETRQSYAWARQQKLNEAKARASGGRSS